MKYLKNVSMIRHLEKILRNFKRKFYKCSKEISEIYENFGEMSRKC